MKRKRKRKKTFQERKIESLTKILILEEEEEEKRSGSFVQFLSFFAFFLKNRSLL